MAANGSGDRFDGASYGILARPTGQAIPEGPAELGQTFSIATKLSEKRGKRIDISAGVHELGVHGQNEIFGRTDTITDYDGAGAKRSFVDDDTESLIGRRKNKQI